MGVTDHPHRRLMRRTTVVDVAQRAGVSLATVSRVINGTAHVSPDKREQVAQAMQALDFHPDPMAQGLRRGQSNAVALLVGDIAQRHFAELTQQVQRALESQGNDLLLFNLGHEPKRLHDFLDQALRMKLRAVVLATSDSIAPSLFKSVHRLLANAIPVISLGQDLTRQGIASIVHEERDATQRSVDYLISRGHKQIAYVGRIRGSAIGRERFTGYQDALRKAKLFDEALVWDMSFRYTAGYEAVTQALSARLAFSALQAGSDEIAMGAIAALADHGLRVPNDVAVIGFGNIDLGGYVRPALTTLSSNPQTAADHLAQLLSQAPKTKKATPPPCILLERQLIVRTSCGQ